MSPSNSNDRDGKDSKTPLATTTPSPHRVSFSSDLPQPQHESESAKPENQQSGAPLLEPASTKDEPPHTTSPNLTVHDRAAAIMSGNAVTGPPIVGSPETTTTPTTEEDGNSSRHTSPPASPPTTFRNRNRGLSLRSSLFTKSIERQVRSPDLGIQRHSFPSSSHSHKHRAVTEQQQQQQQHGKRDGTW
ncbi:hypothetical protein KC318_g15771 [Hortaea werneckii]|nr:hypothetical protein KC334_g15915 [Hortaea werneckii]KAI6936972.1 hypothetical protein KC355_g15854 [Hortaea werneckii]KAI7651345.1 hypothetical protein KC318_g15771 [Hortaea werneckii]